MNIDYVKKIWDNRRVLRYIHYSIYINFRCLPFSQAIKLPIWLYRPNIISCKGKIALMGGVKSGMIRLGFNMVSIYPKNGVTIENRGTIVFNGSCSIGNDSFLSIGNSGKVIFGDRFTATASFKLATYIGISYGDNVSIGWNCMFIDSDFHRLTREDGRHVKGYGKINVGSNVWFGNNCIVMKNTIIPNFTTIAAGTMLSQCLDIPEKTVVGYKRPVEVLQTGIYRDFDDDGIVYSEN